jgi:hypothetical protein
MVDSDDEEGYAESTGVGISLWSWMLYGCI